MLCKILSFLFPRVVYKIKSLVNGEIEIVEFLGKRSIRAGGLQQSGSLVYLLWEKGIKEITKPACRLALRQGGLRNYEIEKVLLLGLGGGSIIPLLNRYFPKAKITAVEIDPLMVAIGRKYFDLGKYTNLTIKICDAFSFVGKDKGEYDLILVDLFLGAGIPKRMQKGDFLENIKNHLGNGGFAVFNYLRNRKNQSELGNFEKNLRKHFKKLVIKKPLVNTLFICS